MTAPRRFYDAAQEGRSAHHRRNLRAAQLGYGPLPRGRRIHSTRRRYRALPRPPRPPFPPCPASSASRPGNAWRGIRRMPMSRMVDVVVQPVAPARQMPDQHREAELRGVRLEARIATREEHAADRHPKAAADQVAFFVQHLEGIHVARISERGVGFHHARVIQDRNGCAGTVRSRRRRAAWRQRDRWRFRRARRHGPKIGQCLVGLEELHGAEPCHRHHAREALRRQRPGRAERDLRHLSAKVSRNRIARRASGASLGDRAALPAATSTGLTFP